MFCSKCGKELEEGEKFCPNCGAKSENGEVDFSGIVSSVSAKAKEGASYAAEQIKHIDVSDAKGIFTNVTRQDSIVYLIVGVMLLFANSSQVLKAVVSGWRWRGYLIGNFRGVCVVSLIALIVLLVYLFSSGKFSKGKLLSIQVVFGITIVLLLFDTLRLLPYFLSALRLLICIVVGIALTAVGTIKLCKDMEQSKHIGVSSPNGTSNINMNGVPIANYDARFDYTPIGMWGYFLYSILFNIPLVGWICWIIFAVGGTRNINLRNFARSYICLYIVMFVLFLLISLFVAALI